MTTSKEIRNEPIWDKAHSSYIRIIYLQNGYTLTGYSKKVGQNERRDKSDLLSNWILRDLTNGYLDKSTTNPKITPIDRIEYYAKRGDSVEHILNLYYEFPEWISTKWLENKKLVSFINRFYFLLRNGKEPALIANELQVRTRAPKQDPLDFSLRRFSNMIDLNAYVVRLRTTSDLPTEAVDNFYRNYKEKHFKL
ncbi:MAG: hypothetical protein JSS79_10235 [Bacteroidetes bacterium]|nr:hypothetical protein [Bacteroidota bacterium]